MRESGRAGSGGHGFAPSRSADHGGPSCAFPCRRVLRHWCGGSARAGHIKLEERKAVLQGSAKQASNSARASDGSAGSSLRTVPKRKGPGMPGVLSAFGLFSNAFFLPKEGERPASRASFNKGGTEMRSTRTRQRCGLLAHVLPLPPAGPAL